jgi:predicted SnoaL-like aldol condensation-catalyzing enzyme
MFNNNKPREAIEKYAGDVYVQHNPAVADGEWQHCILES